jgi:hypothetical protein
MLTIRCDGKPFVMLRRALSNPKHTEAFMEKNHTLFAFKLATKQDAKLQQEEAAGKQKWQQRDGVSIAGCTRFGRFDVRAWGIFGSDTGISC